jgi:hypothetical protein
MKKPKATAALDCLRPVEDRLHAMEGMIVLLQTVAVAWEPPPEIGAEKTSVVMAAGDALNALKDSFRTAWEQIAALK